MLGKIKIVKLTSEGHSEALMEWHEAYAAVAQSLDQGFFAFCEPEKIVINKAKDLRKTNLNKVTLFAPVAGG